MEWNIKSRKGILVSRFSDFRGCESIEDETDPQDTEIAQGEIDPTRASVVGDKVLRTQDKKDEKGDMVLNRLCRSLCECSIVVD